MNHAGENGAVDIYAGQILLARFTAPSIVNELIEFKSHEERHRDIFWAELARRNRPRCLVTIRWRHGGDGNFRPAPFPRIMNAGQFSIVAPNW